MAFPTVRESASELLSLEKTNPLMRTRLQLLQMFRSNTRLSIGEAADRLGVSQHEAERWRVLYYLGGTNLLLSPRTMLDPTPRQEVTFSQHAEIKTLELFKDHNNQMGRQLWVEYEKCKSIANNAPNCEYFKSYPEFEKNHKDWYRTDCQTYIQDVLRYAFEKIGRKDLYTGLGAAYKREKLTNGTVMAKYLVRNQWRAYFIMPDTVNPNDGNAEHTKMYENTMKTKTWWGVPITDIIVNYRPTTRMKNNTPIKQIETDKEGLRKFQVLETALFGVCVFTKALHTALYSKKMIYEVHWTGLSDNKPDSPIGEGDNLYGRVPLFTYGDADLNPSGYIEGIVVVPPDISL